MSVGAPAVKWIMKAPYTSNSKHFQKYVNTSEKAVAIDHIKYVHRNLWGDRRPTCYVIPYMMMQERVMNNREAKLCFLGGKFHHFVVAGCKRTRSFPGYSEKQIAEFAAGALRLLIGHDEFILDGLVRIDVFFNERGNKLEVNELESLEATYYYAKHSEQCETDIWLQHYWTQKILTSISETDVFN